MVVEAAGDSIDVVWALFLSASILLNCLEKGVLVPIFLSRLLSARSLFSFFSVAMVDAFETEEIANRQYQTALENARNFANGIFECEARRISRISLREAGDHSIAKMREEDHHRLSPHPSEYDLAIGDITEEARQTIQELIIKYGGAASCEGNDTEVASLKLFLDGSLVTADGEYREARRRASAVRIIDLWKWRAFSRLQRTHPAYANQMVQWVDQRVRPCLIAFELMDDRSFWYETKGSFRVEVALPKADYGRIKTSISETRLSSPFSLFSAPWRTSTQSDRLGGSTDDRLACAHFALATWLTAPGKDLRHMQWDREPALVTAPAKHIRHQKSSRSPSWIEKREIYLLMAHTLKKRKRRKVNLLELWIPLLPPELCRLILTYFGGAPRSYIGGSKIIAAILCGS